MNSSSLRIAYLTAGAAGMYCGSCMHDNTLARALHRLGVDVQLIPTYTPIRTDEPDMSVDRVYFGGVNVFLQQKFSLFRHLPATLDRLLDQPRFLRWVTSRGLEIDPKELGELTVSMLKGEHGRQRKEVRRLVHGLASSVKPELVTLTNLLIGGSIPEIKRRLKVPVLVTLQGDDVFLEELLEPYQSRALAEIRRLVDHVDGFIVNSQYYADFMQQYLGIPADRLNIVPLGIDTDGFPQLDAGESKGLPVATVDQSKPPTIGFLARLSPEKGLHVLVDAFIALRRNSDMRRARLHVAGWLDQRRRGYLDQQVAKLNEAGLEQDFRFAGTLDRKEKIDFLSELDVLSVPTTYREPKGLYVLEALAAGVPVVQPSHGAFPELLETTGGGCVVTPEDPQALAVALREVLVDSERRLRYAAAGRAVVHERLNAPSMARATLEVYRKYLSRASQGAVSW